MKRSDFIDISSLLLIFVVVACGTGGGSSSNSALQSGKIIFSAHNSNDPEGALELFTIDSDGSNQTALNITGETPDIEEVSSGVWRIGYDVNNDIKIYDSSTEAITDLVSGGTRVDFSLSADTIVYQGEPPQGEEMGINVYKIAVDGSEVAEQLTNVNTSNNAEWPYFSPTEDLVLFFSTDGTSTAHTISTSGTNEQEIPSPGGDTLSHKSFNSEGTEFLNPQNLTSYSIVTGAIGMINDLKSNSTILNQLEALGYEEVPTSVVEGQGGQGTFALSADWSRDGSKIVFDALVRDAESDEVQGIAIFVYIIATDTLTLIYGPEVFEGSRTNNYNYSVYTPKWIP